MNISLGKLWGGSPPTVKAQARRLTDKDPDVGEQDQFLSTTASADGATRMEKLVASTTREAGQQSGSDEATGRVDEWGIAALAKGVGGRPTGVVLGSLGSQVFTSIDADRGNSDSRAVGDVFLGRIAQDEGSTATERTVASTVRSLARDCDSDTRSASRIDGIGLDLLGDGARGSTGKLLGQLGVLATVPDNSPPVNRSIVQDVLYRVADDSGSTPAEAKIAQGAAQGSPDAQSLALLQLAHGMGSAESQ